jgi:deoxycytidylate deaminase
MSSRKKGPYTPDDDLLETAASLDVWTRAKREAERSPMLRFRVGAVVFDNKGILGSGCSNPDIERCKSVCSIHAEHHALRACQHLEVEGAWIAIYTINANGGCAWSSRPCFSCASLLYKRGIDRVIYPERLANNSFIMREDHPEELLSRDIILSGGFAKHQRIPNE